LEAADSVERVTARTFQPSLSILLATEPPTPPVAPQTVINFAIVTMVSLLDRVS
jgi:hypothetical protein